MPAPPPRTCLHADSVFDYIQLRSRRQGITTRREDGAPDRPTLRWRVSVRPGLLVWRYSHPLSPFLCDTTITSLQACSGKAPVFAGRFPEHKHRSGKKIAVKVFLAARLRRSLSNDVPDKHYLFLFFFRNSLQYHVSYFSGLVWLVLFCSSTRYASISLALTWLIAVALVFLCPSVCDHTNSLSRMKNQRRHWVYWWRRVDITVSCEDNTHYT